MTFASKIINEIDAKKIGLKIGWGPKRLDGKLDGRLDGKLDGRLDGKLDGKLDGLPRGIFSAAWAYFNSFLGAHGVTSWLCWVTK